MSHDIEVDADRLDAAMSEFESEQPAPGQSMELWQEPPESEWLDCLIFAFSGLSAYAPAWEIPEDKIEDLARKGAAVMDQWFPHGPGKPERLPPWAQFLVCLGGIVVMYGWDWQRMSLKPLSDEPEPEPEQDTGAANPPQQPGRFSTIGSTDDDE